MSNHDCKHPVDDFNYGEDGKPITVWVCPECGMIWEAHWDIYWAPAEGHDGEPLRITGTPKPS